MPFLPDSAYGNVGVGSSNRIQPARMAGYYTRPLGNMIAREASAMARVPLTIDHIKTGKYVLNVESSDSLKTSFSGFAGTTPSFASSSRPRKKSSSCRRRIPKPACATQRSIVNRATGRNEMAAASFSIQIRLRPAQWGEPLTRRVLDRAAALGRTHPAAAVRTLLSSYGRQATS